LRVTWVQPEDLVGHELRQAREEGKDVDAIEARWLDAGGSPAPGRGASPEPASSELQALALELLDELAALPRPLADREPEGFDEILAAADPVPAHDPVDVAARIEGAWLGRAAGCVLGKPVEGLPREGIRELAEGAGNWPVSEWFTARGVPVDVLERRPWNRASGPTSLAENIDGAPEDDDLNFTMLGVALLERCGPGFDSLDVAKLWLDFLPPGRIFTAERVAMRNLLLGKLPPETAGHRNPFREWIGARLRVDAYGWASGGDPVLAARMAWEDARVSHTANGVYAAMFMAAVHAASLTESSSAAAADAGLSVVPGYSRLAEAVVAARELARQLEWEAVVDELYARHGELHWVHAINNTALVAAALYAFDGDFSGGIGAVVQAGWDTDTNGAAVGSVLGAIAGSAGIDERWTAPLRNRIASSLPGFDGSTIDGLASRTLVAVTPVAHPVS
jgi:ADP-ribosylglycohydrolase